MTSYQVVAPVFIARYQTSNGVIFRSWSPRRYGPIYTYDIVVEMEDDQHPAMNMEYIEALQRVMIECDSERKREESDVKEEMGSFVDMTTDYHCPIPLDERGGTIWFITFQDSLFSPVFFDEQDAWIYLAHLSTTIPTIRSLLHISSARHAFV